MRVVWTRKAVLHLAVIQTYIERDKPEAARRVAEKIRRSVTQLAQHPHLGHPGRKPGTRELIIAGTPYIVPYQVQEDCLTILAVLHGAHRGRGN